MTTTLASSQDHTATTTSTTNTTNSQLPSATQSTDTSYVPRGLGNDPEIPTGPHGVWSRLHATPSTTTSTSSSYVLSVATPPRSVLSVGLGTATSTQTSKRLTSSLLYPTSRPNATSEYNTSATRVASHIALENRVGDCDDEDTEHDDRSSFHSCESFGNSNSSKPTPTLSSTQQRFLSVFAGRKSDTAINIKPRSTSFEENVVEQKRISRWHSENGLFTERCVGGFNGPKEMAQVRDAEAIFAQLKKGKMRNVLLPDLCTSPSRSSIYGCSSGTVEEGMDRLPRSSFSCDVFPDMPMKTLPHVESSDTLPVTAPYSHRPSLSMSAMEISTIDHAQESPVSVIRDSVNDEHILPFMHDTTPANGTTGNGNVHDDNADGTNNGIQIIAQRVGPPEMHVVNIRFGTNGGLHTAFRSILAFSSQLSAFRDSNHYRSNLANPTVTALEQFRILSTKQRMLDKHYDEMCNLITPTSPELAQLALSQSNILSKVLHFFYTRGRGTAPKDMWRSQTAAVVEGTSPSYPLDANRLWLEESSKIVYEIVNCVYRPKWLQRPEVMLNAANIRTIHIDTASIHNYNSVYTELTNLKNLQELYILVKGVKPSKAVTLVRFLNRVAAHFDSEEKKGKPKNETPVINMSNQLGRFSRIPSNASSRMLRIDQSRIFVDSNFWMGAKLMEVECEDTQHKHKTDSKSYRERRKRHRKEQRKRRQQKKATLRAIALNRKVSTHEIARDKGRREAIAELDGTEKRQFYLGLSLNIPFHVFEMLYKWQLSTPRTKTARTVFPRPADENSFVGSVRHLIINNASEHAYWSRPFEQGQIVYPRLEKLTVRGSDFEEEDSDDIASSLLNSIVRDFISAEKVGLTVSYLRRIESHFSCLTHLELHDCMISDLTFLDILVFGQGRSYDKPKNNPLSVIGGTHTLTLEERHSSFQNGVINGFSSQNAPICRLKTLIVSQVAVLESVNNDDLYDRVGAFVKESIRALHPPSIDDIDDNDVIDEISRQEPTRDSTGFTSLGVMGVELFATPLRKQILYGSSLKKLVVSRCTDRFFKSLIQILVLAGYYRVEHAKAVVEGRAEPDFFTDSLLLNNHNQTLNLGVVRRIEEICIDRNTWSSWSRKDMKDEFCTVDVENEMSTPIAIRPTGQPLNGPSTVKVNFF